MKNPHAIQIHCDGAMDYDKNKTGGNGFIIEFPDNLNIEPILHLFRNDGQGIHRLEIISIIDAMKELLVFSKNFPNILRGCSGVEFYTDRMHVTDNYLTNPYKINDWRKNGWVNDDGKEIKDKDLLDLLDKTRKKLSSLVCGRITIDYEREKQNKIADKLSKKAKYIGLKGRTTAKKKNRRVIKRFYNGTEIDYSNVNKEEINVRVYAWENIREQTEVFFEICSEYLHGRIIRTYVDDELKSKLHRGHIYTIKIIEILKGYIKIKLIKEVSKRMFNKYKKESKVSEESLK